MIGSMCRCGVSDWHRLRVALGWTPVEAGKRLGVSRHRIYAYERTPHRCPPAPVVKQLRAELRRASAIAALKMAGVPHPFPPRPRDVGPLCQVCGIPLRMHAQCPSCSSLLGHSPLAIPGECPCGYVLVG